MTEVTALLLLTLLFSVIFYMVTNIIVIIFVVSVWRYGSQLFRHHFFATLHFVHFFVYLMVRRK